MAALRDLFSSKKKILCADLQSIVDGLRIASRSRKQFAAAWDSFADAYTNVGREQLPQMGDVLNSLRAAMVEYADVQRSLAEAEDRNAEDFNDLIERFSVVHRSDTEYHTADKAYREAIGVYNTALQKAEQERRQGTYEKNAGKIEGQIAIAQRKRELCFDKMMTLSEDVCLKKEQYNMLKVRRLKHGWGLYATAIKTAAESEIEILERIEGYIRNIAAENQEIAAEIEEGIEQAGLPPEPVQISIPDTE